MTDTKPAARVRQDISAFGGFLGLAMSVGGGWLPPPGSGSFSAKVWGALIGRDEQTVRTWVHKYRIPYKEPGNEMYISSDDFEKIPYATREGDEDTTEE